MKLPKLPKPFVIGCIDPGKRLCGGSAWLVLPEKPPMLLDARGITGNGSPASMSAALRAWLRGVRDNAEEMLAPVAFGSWELPYYLAMEVPQRYKGKHAKRSGVEALDAVIEQVERDVGALLVSKHTPNEWKAQVPKRVHHRRVRAALTPEERAMVLTPDDHNTWDGVGYGLFIVGRLGRGGV